MSLELEEQYEKIYTFCYFKVRSREVAEDLTQETFLKYFESTNYLERGKKLAYLYTIARNSCIDYFRRQKDTLSFDELLDTAATNSDIETRISVQAAIAELSFDEQELLLLRYTNELGMSEISQYLGISRFALYRKLKSVEQKLKSHLRKEDFYE